MAGPYLLGPTSPVQLLSAATTGNGGVILLRGQTARVTVVLQSNGTTSGGTLTIEEAYYDDIPSTGGSPGVLYAGTWSAIGAAINASAFTGTAQLVTHITGSVWALRVRVSSDITGGGTVSCWAWGN